MLRVPWPRGQRSGRRLCGSGFQARHQTTAVNLQQTRASSLIGGFNEISRTVVTQLLKKKLSKLYITKGTSDKLYNKPQKLTYLRKVLNYKNIEEFVECISHRKTFTTYKGLFRLIVTPKKNFFKLHHNSKISHSKDLFNIIFHLKFCFSCTFLIYFFYVRIDTSQNWDHSTFMFYQKHMSTLAMFI